MPSLVLVSSIGVVRFVYVIRGPERIGEPGGRGCWPFGVARDAVEEVDRDG